MDFKRVKKAIAGAVVAGASAPGAMIVTIPPEANAPWWGYILAGIVSAAIGYLGVYIAPKNAD